MTDESKTERIGLAITPAEMAALELLHHVHPGQYEGVSSVVRDYSLREAVAFAERVRVVHQKDAP